MDPAEVWRERVEDALTVELGVLAHRGLEPHASGFLGPGPVAAPTGLGAIAALAGVGLLGDDDAARWRARFADADRPFLYREPDDDLRTRIHAYLGFLAEQAYADVDGAEVRLAAVLRALGRVGLLDEEAARWWRGLLPHRDDPQVSVHASLGPLRRSVPGPAWRRRGLRVLAVDLFERGVCVRMHLARDGRNEDGGLTPMPDDTSQVGPLASWDSLMLRDDIQTRYAAGGGASGGAGGHADGPISRHVERVFSPAVPERARLLLVFADDERPHGAPVTDVEPHRFLAAQHAYLAAFGPLDLADGRDAGFTVDAFEMIGLLEADEARDWRRRLARLSLEWPEKPLLPEPIRATARAYAHLDAEARRVLEAVGALSWRDGDAAAMPELVVERVLPAPPHAAHELTVAAAVLFRDAVRIHWYAETLHGEGHGGLSLVDDAGTSYERLSAISGGSGRTLVAASSFVPAPPPPATWLDVLRDGTRIVRIPLT